MTHPRVVINIIKLNLPISLYSYVLNSKQTQSPSSLFVVINTTVGR
jgi:hypothetical protein